MSTPTLEPSRRSDGDVTPAGSYDPGDPVWVYRDGDWRAGVVEQASAHAATVTYRRTNARGTGVDTVTAQYLAARAEPDPDLDNPRQAWVLARRVADPVQR